MALLGGSNAIGVLLAGLLFGAMKATGPAMQSAGVSPDILSVVQGLIILFVAAPPLIKAMFRLPNQRSTIAIDAPTTNKSHKKAKALKEAGVDSATKAEATEDWKPRLQPLRKPRVDSATKAEATEEGSEK